MVCTISLLICPQRLTGTTTVPARSCRLTTKWHSKTCFQIGYYQASNKMINEVQFMNVEQIPYAVVNRWLNNTPYPDQGTVYVDFVYLPDTKLLKVGPVSIPMDDGLVFMQPQELIEIVWSHP